MAVHRGVKFTCHFTLMELTDRWNALLYDPIISKLALSAVKNLVGAMCITGINVKSLDKMSLLVGKWIL